MRSTDYLEGLAWEGTPEQAVRGSSLGNPDAFLRADAEANLDGLWLAANGRWYAGEWTLRPQERGDWTLLRVVYAPAYQAAIYTDTAGGRWEKRLFLADGGGSVFLWLRGAGLEAGRQVALVCDGRVVAARSEGHRQQPWQDCERQWKIARESAEQLDFSPLDEAPDGLTLQASHAWTEKIWTEPARVRLRFSPLPAPDGTLDFWLRLTALPDTTAAPQDQSPRIALDAAEQALLDCLTLTPFPERKQASRLAETIPGPQSEPSRAENPSSGIERAAAWGKIGSRRVWHRYGTGDWGFNNDPPGSIVVTRDAAWFLFGADHFAPHWSRALLETLVRHAVTPEGKIAEYIRLDPAGVNREDYGLNINDATPLFVLSVAHHWRTLRSQSTEAADSALKAFYPAAAGAADWMLRQRQEGLVWCAGAGTSAWGIGSWRNIIPGYRLAGAVTELNALCVAALRAAGELAKGAGDSAGQSRFHTGSRDLSGAMEQLVDPQTGFFFRNRDEQGASSQLTIDLAFPALFRAGPEEPRVRTLLRLAEEDFRCPSGLRTLSNKDPAYHPRFGWGLMGGSWPNATAWVAAALAPYRPDLAWQLAEQIACALFPETRIGSGVGVPGQFPEWFDGDTGESAGMSLSPWMPATYVWLLEEGLRGGFYQEEEQD